MTETKILNFSLGPVQGFIASARKTRDFWTGSFLLSYLAGQAIAVILEGRGEIILPAVAINNDGRTEPLLQAIMERGNNKNVYHSNDNIIATLPNRFRAKVPKEFNPELCKEAVRKSWTEIAELIWDRYLDTVSILGRSTKDIWQRQVNNFWDINWILSDDPAALDLRKNWRCHVPPDEPGDKCTLFGDKQELSGYLRIHERVEQDKFWYEFRQQERAGVFYDLGDNERLCAIALIKRFFPYIAPKIIFEVPINYPSTPYLASVNWIAQVVDNETEKIRNFSDRAAYLPDSRGRENPDIFSILRNKLGAHPYAREFASLDGNCFFKATLENPNLWDRPSNPAQSTRELRKHLVEELNTLTEPSPFYAMLLMDGDRLGALLQEHKERTKDISRALNHFSLNVPLLIKDGNGVTVFAGGDDVLAFMPLENALSTAIKLYNSYLCAFAIEKIQATISGAIIYSHFNTPLTEVYHEAQQLLSDIAKEKTGRNSLAVAVWKRAGKVLTWSAPWKIVTDKFLPFQKSFQGIASDKDGFRGFSNSFLYDVQSRLSLFFDNEKGNLSGFNTEDIHDLLIAEYIKNRGADTNREHARKITDQMLELCLHYWNDKEGNTQENKNKMQLDSIFLTKFLIEKGV